MASISAICTVIPRSNTEGVLLTPLDVLAVSSGLVAGWSQLARRQAELICVLAVAIAWGALVLSAKGGRAEVALGDPVPIQIRLHSDRGDLADCRALYVRVLSLP